MNIHKDKAHEVELRTVASTQTQDCNQLIKIFLGARRAPVRNRLTAALTHPVESIRKSLSKLVYKTRIGFLRVTGSFSINSIKKSEKFAYLANSAFEDNLIEADDLRNLAARYEQAKRTHLYYDENLQKLVVNEGDVALSDDEVTSFLRRYKITDPSTKYSFKVHSVTKSELEVLKRPTLGFNQLNAKDTLTYLHVCRSYSKRAQVDCLSHIESALLGTSSNKFIRRYIKVKKKTDRFFAKEMNKKLKALRIDNPMLQSENLPKNIKEELEQKAFLNKSLRISCQSSMRNTARRNARGKLLQMILIGEAVSAGWLYYFNERHKDYDKEWVSELGENLAYHFVSGYIHSVITSSAAGIPTKIAGVWLEEAIKDSYAAYSYSTHLNPNETRVREEVEKFLRNPEFRQNLESILRVVEKEDIYRKVEEEINRYIAADGEELSTEDYEQSIDQLTDVLTYLAYKDISNGLIETGDIGMDYYAFNRIWDLGYSSISMGYTLGAYSMMCRHPNLQKTRAVVGGAVVYAFGKYGLDKLYEQLRVMGLGF